MLTKPPTPLLDNKLKPIYNYNQVTNISL